MTNNVNIDNLKSVPEVEALIQEHKLTDEIVMANADAIQEFIESKQNATLDRQPVLEMSGLNIVTSWYSTAINIDQNLYNVGINKDILGKDLKDDFDYSQPQRIPAHMAATQFLESYLTNQEFIKGPYIYGDVGVGKTYLAALLAHSLSKNGVKTAIVNMPIFASRLKDLFGNKEFDRMIYRVQNSQVLIIDDLGAERITEWTRDNVLMPIFEFRMNRNMPTIITSNISLENLPAYLHIQKNPLDDIRVKRIVSRIDYLTKQVEMIGDNKRN